MILSGAPSTVRFKGSGSIFLIVRSEAHAGLGSICVVWDESPGVCVGLSWCLLSSVPAATSYSESYFWNTHGRAAPAWLQSSVGTPWVWGLAAGLGRLQGFLRALRGAGPEECSVHVKAWKNKHREEPGCPVARGGRLLHGAVCLLLDKSVQISISIPGGQGLGQLGARAGPLGERERVLGVRALGKGATEEREYVDMCWCAKCETLVAGGNRPPLLPCHLLVP